MTDANRHCGDSKIHSEHTWNNIDSDVEIKWGTDPLEIEGGYIFETLLCPGTRLGRQP